MFTSLMSRPRAATSVATRTGTRPDRNWLRIQSRSRCSLSPWIAEPMPPMLRAIWSHIFLVPQNTIALSGCVGGLRSTSIRRCCFWNPPHTSTTCVMSLLATRVSVSPMLTWMGLVRMAVATRTTALGHVAVKNSVCRCAGARDRIFRICGSNPMSSILSASSSTTYVDEPRLTAPDSRKSLSLPGVAIAICGPWRSSRSWCPLGAPP
mmetsp:Transcript_3195/g.13874  ORF Transcript_3195/g.13874 Transcript_3195/m.13874 type:complete len:208 (-) Transcript_3195:755-1378(-)